MKPTVGPKSGKLRHLMCVKYFTSKSINYLWAKSRHHELSQRALRVTCCRKPSHYGLQTKGDWTFCSSHLRERVRTTRPRQSRHGSSYYVPIARGSYAGVLSLTQPAALCQCIEQARIPFAQSDHWARLNMITRRTLGPHSSTLRVYIVVSKTA